MGPDLVVQKSDRLSDFVPDLVRGHIPGVFVIMLMGEILGVIIRVGMGGGEG